MRLGYLPVSLFCLCALLTGCVGVNEPTPEGPEPGAMITGSVHGGQQAVSGATITIFAVGKTGYGSASTALTTAVTSTAAGNFTVPAPTCTGANAGVATYILASGGNSGSGVNPNIMLGAALGPCTGTLPANIAINEVSTAAMAYAMGHFFTTTIGAATPSAAADAFGTVADLPAPLANADRYTVPLLVSVSTGQALTTTTSGSLTITRESQKLSSIADTLAACVNSAGQTSTTDTSTNCGKLFSYTLPPGATTRPSDTLQAAVEMARYPYQQVSNLYKLAAGEGAPYTGLSTQPNDWTLGIGYTSTTFGLTVAGTSTSGTSSTIDIDTNGNVWFPSNTATSHGLGEWNITAGAFGGPYATGLTTPQYVAIDPANNVFGNDASGNHVLGVNASSTGTTITLATSGPTGPLAVGYADTAPHYSLTTIVNGDQPISFIGTTQTTVTSPAMLHSASTGLAVQDADNIGVQDNSVDSSSSSGCYLDTTFADSGDSGQDTYNPAVAANCQSGGLILTLINSSEATLAFTATNSSGSMFCSEFEGSGCVSPTAALSRSQGLAYDGDANIWIANSGSSSVSTFGFVDNATSPIAVVTTATMPYLHGSANGGTMTIPYGLAIDGAGNVWVSNAGCNNTSANGCTPTSFTLSELIGAAGPTVTPLGSQNVAKVYGTRPQ